VVHNRETTILPRNAFRVLFYVPLFLLLLVAPVVSQKAQPDDHSLPKYDPHTEFKTKGAVDEINVLPLGVRKDFIELVVESGADRLHIYVCPKTFQDEMGISFSKSDEIGVTGSKVKQGESDVILAREIVKGTDTLMFRDEKGNPVWDPRTGK
jgi:hypothetical protein